MGQRYQMPLEPRVEELIRRNMENFFHGGPLHEEANMCFYDGQYDFYVPKGTRIHAPHSGTVMIVKEGPIVSRQDPRSTQEMDAAHQTNLIGVLTEDQKRLSRITHVLSDIPEGQNVEKGDDLGRVGGYLSGSHVHYNLVDIRSGRLLKPRFEGMGTADAYQRKVLQATQLLRDKLREQNSL